MVQMKEHHRISGKKNQMEISNPSDNEFKVMVIKVLTELRMNAVKTSTKRQKTESTKQKL